jgi:membrane protein YqaA with SNARE-associated domain
MHDLLLLFLTAFGAATLLPLYSEVVLIALMQAPDANQHALWLVATLGNTLGAVVNWFIGRYLSHFEQLSWFPFKMEKLHRAQHWFNRYGWWSLLFSWLPIGGDALTFIAGLMRVPLHWFLLLTLLAKGGRYAVLMWLTLGIL